MADKDKGIVDFSAQDSEYADRINAAKARVPKPQYPPLPRLDQPPARPSGGAATTVEAAKRVLTPEQQEQLRASGGFIPGVGSGYAANQPRFRGDNGESAEDGEAKGPYVNPPRPPGSGLRPETVQQLEEVAKVNTAPAKIDDEEVKKITEDIEEIDSQFETDEYGRRVRSLTANKERREAIEKRCAAMDIEDFIMQGEVRQKVPVLPGKIEPVFRSIAGHEDLFIKRLMSAERGSEQYLLDRYSLLNLTAGLYGMNGRVFPNHLNKDGDPDESLFNAKMKAVSRMPVILLSDLSINYIWFSRRVQKLLVVDNIKGF